MNRAILSTTAAAINYCVLFLSLAGVWQEQFPYDAILPRLKEELDALIARRQTIGA